MKIRITGTHIYLDEYDISPFVIGGSLKVEGEQLALRLTGEITDEREPEPKKIAPKIKEVKDGDG